MRTLFEETFDSVILGESVDEGNFGEMVWSAQPPAGWTVDNSNMPAENGELLGTTEWRELRGKKLLQPHRSHT